MRILIADDQDRVRHALRVLLVQQPDLEIVGEAANGLELLALAQASMPDLILVDQELPELAQAGGLPALRSSHDALQIAVLSSRPGGRRTAQAAGADAFVSKSDPPERLLAVLRRCGEMTGRRSKCIP